jgi:hypothetical protein
MISLQRHGGEMLSRTIDRNSRAPWHTALARARRLGIVALVLWAAGFGSGCCCLDRMYCPQGCEAGPDPLLDSCNGGGSCGGCCPGPFSQMAKCGLTCGGGCGNIYWGEWINNPPDQCDPCNNCGNFTGPRCCPPLFWDQFWGGLCCLWGGRFDSCCNQHSGCASCGGTGSSMTDGEMIHDGEVVPSPPPTPAFKPPQVEPEVTPTPKPTPASQIRRPVPNRGMPSATMHGPHHGLQRVQPAGGTVPYRRRSI